jgi:hypothetical protein
MATISKASPSNASKEFFDQERWARAELLLAITQLLGSDASKQTKLQVIEAAREYLAADEQLDTHRSPKHPTYWSRRDDREQLKAVIAMIEGEDESSTAMLDAIIRELGKYLTRQE